MLAAEVNALAVSEALARPGDPAALEMARLSIRVLESLGETFRRLTTEEELLAKLGGVA